jgi:hypothetical protein
VVTDKTKGLSVTCTSSVAKGTLKNGSGLAGAGLGTVTSLAFKGCTVSGITVSVTITGKMPLNATSYNATTKVASMTITKIHGSISVSAISCSATIDGTGAAAHNGMVKARSATDRHAEGAGRGWQPAHLPQAGLQRGRQLMTR